jgi:ABC-2 type transport system permease protein
MVLFMVLLMPLLQLFVLGNAFGGRATHLVLAVVDVDGGPGGATSEALHAPETNGDMLRPVVYGSEQQAANDA